MYYFYKSKISSLESKNLKNKITIMNYSKDQLIKETGLNEKDLHELREQFVKKYAKLKGWDAKFLSTEQLNEVYSQPEYKKPGLLLS